MPFPSTEASLCSFLCNCGCLYNNLLEERPSFSTTHCHYARDEVGNAWSDFQK